MWAFIFRKLIYNVPVYLGIIFVMMAALRVNDPTYAFRGKNASLEQIDEMRAQMDLNRPLLVDVAFWRGPWAKVDSGYGGSALVKGAGETGRFRAIWSAQLSPGTYKVYATWPPVRHGATDAEYHIYDGPMEADIARADLSKPPDSVSADGAEWDELGEYTFATGVQRIVLTNKADGRVVADAMRFVPVGGADDAAATIVDASGPGFETKGNPWTLARFAHSFVDNQYLSYMWRIVRLDFSQQSWAQKGRSVGNILVHSIPPSLSITLPTLVASASISICIGLLSAYFRGRAIDRTLVILAVLGMSISFLVYIIFGQFFGAFWPQHAGAAVQPFAITGYKPWMPLVSSDGHPINWVTYCMLPVIIGVVVAMGYDTRFYRAVMVEETNRDYITTATAKGASKPKIIFVHMLKNAMIPIITRIMATLPFLITGSILLEMYFRIPGMGFQLINAITARDFPVIQAFVAAFAAIFILSVILTDVLYALVDPRVRLS